MTMKHDYAREKLTLLIRDLANYNGDEFWRQMSRIANGATHHPSAEGLQEALKLAVTCLGELYGALGVGECNETFQHCEALKAIEESQSSGKESGFVKFRPIEEADKYSQAMLLYSEEFINLDFNPEGVIEGYWQDDEGWIGAVWNGCHDYWAAVVVEPTHFIPKPHFKHQEPTQ